MRMCRKSKGILIFKYPSCVNNDCCVAKCKLNFDNIKRRNKKEFS